MLMRSRAPRRSTRGTRQLRVLMPRGLAGLARESGIGAAMRHQETVVRSLGHQVVTNPLHPFDVVHLNTPFPDTAVLARLYRRGDAVITPSSYSRALVSAPKYGVRRPIHVLSHGIDTDFFRPAPTARGRLREQLGLAPHARVVISVGMQLVRKGILDWVEVARRMPQVTFEWCGRTDARLLTSDVERALASAPRNAIFPGYIRSEQLREAYCGADAFCFLTKEETEGIVLLEALACGAPALVRAIPLYREQLPDGVLTHQVGGDGPEFAGEVVRRLTDLLEGR